MRRIIFSLLVCSLLFAACNNSAGDKKNTADTSAATADTTATADSFALNLAGIYHGYIPCADCPGIVTYLLLNPDMTYRMEETYYKKSDSLFLTSGKWKTENGKIVLMDGAETKNSYQPEGEKLWQLDYQGDRISGNLGDKYMLTRQARADNKQFKEKADAGIDFVANGNEPFWSLEIDKGKNLIFNRPGFTTPDSIAYAEPVVKDGIREYHIQAGTKKLDIKISPQFCSDGMSDFVYEYKVELEYNKKKYSGCGRLLSEL